ncbi:MAG: GNAT family N-acetyltransferase [Defluviitaleaceae bacterium]|nr:GNAT family N-acetyltransferase [Defluviitaleaceae bacterium]
MNKIEIHDTTKEEQGHIIRGIIDYNNSKVPFTQEPTFVSINRCIKDGEKVVGGIVAEIYCWKVLHIDILWVKEEYRNKGYATALMNDAEETAKEMGCKLSHLSTFDFQARELYEKLGYAVFGTLEDCPDNHNCYYMSKKL